MTHQLNISENIEVILVNSNDEEIGRMEKMEAHQKGLLHRAFSVFVFNSNNELLLQRRAFGKYHSEGLWTNTCCSHPAPGETVLEAGNRRMKEEMGMECNLQPTFSFTYKVELDNNLFEHELDHVLIGRTDVLPCLNPEEASGYRYASLDSILSDIVHEPDSYTSWLKIILEEHLVKLQESLIQKHK